MNKIKDNKGVSILFSLLLFLVVSLVSVTVIAASHSSTKRTVSMSQTNQENINIDSAVRLCIEEVDNRAFAKNDWNEWWINSDTYFSDLLSSIKNSYFTWANKSNPKAANISYSSSPYYTISTNIDELSNIKVYYKYHFETSGSYLVLKLVSDNSNNVNYIKFLITPNKTSILQADFITYSFSEVSKNDY